MGRGGTMRANELKDGLGHLIPPGQLQPSSIEQLAAEAMSARRFSAGIGVPSVPTRYVVAMHPADRAWLSPWTEDQIARALERRADEAGMLLLGRVEVEFRIDDTQPIGQARVWCGFAGEDLLVLASPEASLQVFEQTPA